jgi:hypothetical protein
VPISASSINARLAQTENFMTMQTYGWAALTAIIAATTFSACNGGMTAPDDSVLGSGGNGGSDTKFFAAEDDPDGMGGDRPGRPNGQGGAELCERFTEFDDTKTAYNRAKREIAATFPGYVHRDCRVSGFSTDPSFLADMPNRVIELTLHLWKCEGYEFGDDYSPELDFPLSLPNWQVSAEEVEAFTEAYLSQVKNSGLDFTDFEIDYFRYEIGQLAQGAANDDLSGFSRSTCNAGVGGAGVGGAGGDAAVGVSQ